MANGLTPHTVVIDQPMECADCKTEQPAGTTMTLVHSDPFTAEEDWACPECVKAESGE